MVADVEDWLARVGEALGVPVADVLPKDLRGEMLDLTGDIAHNVVRVAVPWTSYLMGVAVGRGASPAEALRIVRGLLAPGSADEQQERIVARISSFPAVFCDRRCRTLPPVE